MHQRFVLTAAVWCDHPPLGLLVGRRLQQRRLPYLFLTGPSSDEKAILLETDCPILVCTKDDPVNRLCLLRLHDVRNPAIVIADACYADIRELVVETGAVSCFAGTPSVSDLDKLLPINRGSFEPFGRYESGVWLCPVQRCIGYHGAFVQLTDHEYRVLDCLLRHSPRPVSLGSLHTYAWGKRLPARSRPQIATVTVSRLRQRLRQLESPLRIIHVHEFGYVLSTTGTL